MTRSLAGSFDPHGLDGGERLLSALAPEPASVAECGPLRVAYTGPPVATDNPLCLLGGFIDNARELRRARDGPAIQERGVTVPAACDGRAIAAHERLLAAAYGRWRAELPAHLRGEFALVIWDRERGEGLLARDQLGVRCLYLHKSGATLFFATEIRHLLALLPRTPAPDPAGVAHWVAASHRPGTATLYEGIRRLAAGSALRLVAGEERERRYWTPRFVEPPQLDAVECGHRLRGALDRAVRRRLAGGGGTAILMSGGLDSASVAALAARQAPGRIAAYAAVFPEHPAVDESGLIAGLREALALPGATAEVRAGGLLASALESMSAWRLPLASWGEFWSLPLVRAAAAAGSEVVLGGDGGDELFDTRAFLLADLLRAGRPRAAFRLARELAGTGGQPSRRALLRAVRDFGLAGALSHRVHAPAERRLAGRRLPRWLTRTAAADLLASDDPLAWKQLDGPRWWAHGVHCVRRIEELGLFEMHRHRAALAGVEARHPMLDLDVVELVLGQPPEATFDRHRDRPLLRASVEGAVPDAVRLRSRKALFDSLVVDTLARSDGAAVRRLLGDPAAEVAAYVDLPQMRHALLEDESARARDPFHWMLHTWRLAAIECWLRTLAGASIEQLAGGDASNRRLIVRVVGAPPASPARARTAPTPTFFHLDAPAVDSRLERQGAPRL